MDENTPPVGRTSVGDNQSNKQTVLGSSPVINTILKSSNKDNLLQSPVNKSIKVSLHQSPKLTASTVISNSPKVPQETADSEDDEIQFQPRSYTLDENADPFKTKSGLANSPVKAVGTDVVETKTMASPAKGQGHTSMVDQDGSVLTSMVGSEDSENSLKPITELQKSPGRDASHQPVTEGQLPDSPDDMDPFKPRAQIQNSPADTKVVKVNSLPENLDEIDPFKSNNKVGNSPVKSTSENICDLSVDVSVAKSPAKILGTETSVGAGLPESLDDVDPLKPKSQIMNSPCQNSTINSTLGTADLTVIENLSANFDDIDPFKPKSQIENSPTKESSSVSDGGTSAQQVNMDDTNPFVSKTQIQNSPVKNESADSEVATASAIGLPDNNDIDPFQCKTQIQNSPIKKEATLPVETLTDLTKLPENLDDVDPFKPITQVQNSPVMNRPALSEVPSAEVTGLPENLDNIDPFKPKTQMQNSPVKPASPEESTIAGSGLPDNLDDIDPFKPKTQMQNSPLKPASSVKSTTEVIGLPDNLDDIDPFKPKTQMQNSPVKPANSEESPAEVIGLPDNLDDIDPFKTKTQIQNSPAKPACSGDKSDVNELPENLDNIDPFQPKSQIVNSPAVKSGNFKEEAETDAGAEPLDANEDPFKTKSQIPDSPTSVANSELKNISHEKDTSAPQKTSDVDLDMSDPFTTKSNVAKSPVRESIPEMAYDDPFKTKSQIQNSPDKRDCPLDFNSIDPFHTKTKIQNSPGKTELNDPFADQLKIADSSEKPSDMIKPEQLTVDPFDNLDAFDPFQGRMKTGNTPSRNNNELGLQNTPKMQNQGGLDLGSNLMCMIAPENKIADSDGMDFTNEDFRPANEVFSDPNVWDMLEKFGNSNSYDNAESDLARMSLYVKFDPLVNSKPLDSPTAQHQTGVGRGLQKMEVVRDGDESIMLMGTPPRGGGRRRSILVQRRPPASVSKTIFEEENVEEKKPAKPHIVDLIFSCSPESENSTEMQGLCEQKPQASPTLPENNKKDETFFEVVEVLKYSETDVKRLLQKQKQELLLEFQGRQLTMEQELSKKQTALGTEAKHYKEKAEQLEVKNKEMRQVVVEYETFINELVTEKEKNTSESKECKIKLKSERDQAIEDLQSVEKSFADLHRRYEKVKAVLEDYRKNEDTLKKTNQGLITKMQHQDEAINKLKSQAESKLKQLREEKEKEKAASSGDIIKLQAALKKSELHAQGLEKTLEQKGKEIAELTDLCDTLIAKVGGS